VIEGRVKTATELISSSCRGKEGGVSAERKKRRKEGVFRGGRRKKTQRSGERRTKKERNLNIATPFGGERARK